jgi:hypothetical protein
MSILFGKSSKIATNRREDQELTMLALDMDAQLRFNDPNGPW